MRRWVAVPVLAAVTIAVTLVAVHRAPAATRPGHVETLHLAAPGQGRRREVLVYRPSVADSSQLPVVYFLHGLPGGASDVFDADAETVLNRLFATGAPPFVLVAPDGNGADHEDTEWADAVDGTDQLETWVTTTVREAVEGAHPRPASRRGIAGFSMGGYGAVNLAFRHPDLYGQVVAIAGYFHVDDPDGVFGGRDAVVAANTPISHVDRAAGMRIGLFDGDEEDIDVIRGQADALHEALAAVGVASTVSLTPGAHDWDYGTAVLPDVLAFLSAGYR